MDITAANMAASDGPPPPLPGESVALFKEGISLILSRWSALQMAVENEWGGRGSRAIADQLCSDVFSWFTQSKDTLYIDDLENILDETMLSLNTMTEDGSVEEVAEKLMILHGECLEGNYQSIVDLRASSSQMAARSHVKQALNDEDDDSSDEDDDMSNMMVDTPESVSKPSSANIPTSDTRVRETAEAEDGWTVVSSRRGSKGKKN
ncbi:hypothetical protein Pint_20582 [Pistacia integerrima]|uniref:Uncharacterized protein n=1 Tax=Pistacia integerrima TaxID=434235 RepID=A0ACC0XEZ6_9ROSI|nr:hypothetical protein Pint_20582 [Pistacia integerrima]